MEIIRQKGETKVLIVEDSTTQAKLLKYVLEKHGFKVAVAYNGKEALNLLADYTPALIISDIVMPVMDGYSLCESVKRDKKLNGIPVLLLTTLSEPEDVIKGLESGADSFITKPYDDVALISRINYILLNGEMRNDESATEMGIEIVFAGKKHFVTSSRIQILDLLISTYENAVQKARELEKTVIELKRANDTIKSLKGLIPICAKCKKVRDDDGYWHQIEQYISEHSEADFTHGFCPECLQKLYPKYARKVLEDR